MVDLLHVTQVSLPRAPGVRLALPFKVSPNTAPYLVSGAKTPVVWLEEAPTGILRAGIRSPIGINNDIIDAITLRGLQSEWGNVQDFTADGITACVKYLKDMGFKDDELDFLVAPGTSFECSEDLENIPIIEADWMKEKSLIVVPRDRSYLGFIGNYPPDDIVAVVHNPSRGIAIAR